VGGAGVSSSEHTPTMKGSPKKQQNPYQVNLSSSDPYGVVDELTKKLVQLNQQKISVSLSLTSV